MDPCTGQFLRTLHLNERLPFNTEDGDPKCPEIWFCGCATAKNRLMMLCYIPLLRKGWSIGDNFTVFAYCLVRTYMWDGAKPTTGCAVHH